MNAPDTQTTDAPQAVRRVSRALFEAFQRYNDNYRRITQRARGRFETRDWRGSQADLRERIELWNKAVGRMVSVMRRQLDGEVDDRATWAALKTFYGERVEGFPDAAFARTFFSSVSRRVFDTVGVAPDVEFTADDLGPVADGPLPLPLRSYLVWDSLAQCVGQLLEDSHFHAPFADLDAAVAEIADALDELPGEVRRIELVVPTFYQSTRAYLVGRVHGGGWWRPMAIALKHAERGIEPDAVITNAEELSQLFGFTRSYFFVDLPAVKSAVRFLSELLPDKPIDELYTVLGRARQGKTERYRAFSQHLAASEDLFEVAAGDKGLVMAVFTLPSYDVVFKVIRDRFGQPKNMTRDEVLQKYDLVFKHDRAGRLIDTQEFHQLEFPVRRFSQPVLDELLNECAGTVHVEGDRLVIDHVYLERRIRPLNLYLREVDEASARLAVADYGQAVKDLARTNIFPGDLLLKNFGVTRHGRVIFYDYDELVLVTDCNFRRWPRAHDEQHEMDGNTWFYVADNDVFPEQFERFLGLDAGLREYFMSRHGELLTTDFWRAMQQLHDEDALPEVLPYSRRPTPLAAADLLSLE